MKNYVIAAGLAIIVIGCDSGSQIADGLANPEEGPLIQPAPPLELAPPTLDERFADLSRSVDGAFGGLYMDDGVLQIVLTRRDKRLVVEEALRTTYADLVPDNHPAKVAAVNVVDATYAFHDLVDWKASFSAGARSIPGLVFVDVSEKDNAIVVGVEAGLESQAEDRFRSLGIPSDAFRVVVASPSEPLVSLRDKVRPMKGGLEIQFEDRGKQGWPTAICTFGMIAKRGAYYGLVTNAHCTGTGKEGFVLSELNYYQDDEGLSSEYIGFEKVDPAFYDPEGGGAKRIPQCDVPCRQSDSAFIEFDDLSNQDIQFGRIAKTNSRHATSGSITLNGTFLITAYTSSHILGTEVDKVGRTTGWTYGDISQTCVDKHLYSNSIVYLCQYEVDGGSGGGDSGSPVFVETGSGNVTLYGMLWGKNLDTDDWIYSPISSVNYELSTDAINP